MGTTPSTGVRYINRTDRRTGRHDAACVGTPKGRLSACGGLTGFVRGPAALVLLVLTTLILGAAVLAPAQANAADWRWSNPLPQGNELSGVAFADADHGWMVGDYGTVLVTSDGGTTWTRQDTGTTEHLYALDFTDALHGWAVGSAGTILVTSDGGTTWTPQTSAVTEPLYDVEFVDDLHGWAVGELGLILVTSDGGANWAQQNYNDMVTLYDVDFVDANTGWAVGADWSATDPALILATTDGGTTWVPQSSGVTGFEYVYGITFADANTGWAVGTMGSIVATTNGGATWSPQASGTTEPFSQVVCSGTSNVWATTWSGQILATDDGGTNWTETSLTGVSLWGISFSDASNGWAVGSAGKMFQTTDGGTSWWEISSGPWTTQNGGSFASATSGRAVGDDGAIFATSDGGATWSPETSGTTVRLNDVSWIDDSHGWTAGENGEILVYWGGEADGHAQTSGTSSSLYAIDFINTQTGWAVGDDGTIRATTNGGADWVGQTSGVTDRLNDVCFVDADHGWAVGDSGTILVTTDGGYSWDPQNSGTSGHLLGVSFVDTSHGWAVGNTGTILATTNGGATWTQQTSPTTDDLESVCFVDASNGWAVGWNGTIVTTTNGGATWTQEGSGTRHYLYGLDFVDATHGWIAGSSGTILVTGEPPVPGAPTVTISGDSEGWSAWPVDLTVAATVDPSRTLTALEYSTDGGSSWAEIPGSGLVRMLSISDEGETGVIVRVTDSAAETATDATTVRVDTTDPTASDNAPGGWVTGDQTVALDTTAGPSGIAELRYRTRLDDDPWSDWTVLSGQTTVDVDLSGEGEHFVQYWAASGAGRTSDVELAVVRIDETVPVVSVAGADDAWHAGPVTLSFTPTVGPSGLDVVQYWGGEWWSDIIPVAGAYTLTVTGNGEHGVLYRAVNKAGVASDEGMATVRIDTVVPTISVSGNDDAWHSDPVTLTFTPSTGDSGVAAVQYRVGAGDWQDATDAGKGDYTAEIGHEGENVVSYRVRNNAGTESDVGRCTVKIDTATPTVAVSGDDAAWHAEPVTLTFTATAGGSGLAGVQYVVGAGEWEEATEMAPGVYTADIGQVGDNTVRFKATSNVGAESPTGSCTVRIDDAVPTVSDNAPRGWVTGPQTVTLEAHAGGPSGIGELSYRTRLGDDPWGDWTVLLAQTGVLLPVIGDGEHYIQYRATSGAGMTSDTGLAVVRIGGGGTPPTIAVSGADDDWHAGPVTLTFVPDCGSSGLAAVEYRIGEGAWTGITPVAGTHTLTLTEDGEHRVSYRAQNNDGVYSEVGAATVKIDGAEPTVSDDAPGGWVAEARTLNLRAQAGGPSGLAELRYRTRLDDGAWGTWTVLASQAVADVPLSGDGAHFVQYRATSGSGVTSDTEVAVVRIDGVIPTVSITGPDTVWHAGRVTLGFTPTAGRSGVANVQYRLGDGAWTDIAAVSGAYTITSTDDGEHAVSCRTLNGAGVASTIATTTVGIDTVKPRARAVKKVSTLRRDRRGAIKVRITKDPAGCGKARVIIRIYKGKQLKKRLRPAKLFDVNKVVKVTYPYCKLNRGRYTIKVTSVDAVGNEQVRANVAKLVVK